jgi:hypothetical protein
LPDIEYGRKDATSADAKLLSNIPTDKNYKEKLAALGFEDNEIVALSAIHGFGNVWDPVKKNASIYPKLDNYFFK